MLQYSLHLFVFVVLDVERVFLHRQQKIPVMISMLNRRKQVVTTIPMIIGAEDRLVESRNEKQSYRLRNRKLNGNKPSFISISCPQISRFFFEHIANFKNGKSFFINQCTRLFSIGKHRFID